MKISLSEVGGWAAGAAPREQSVDVDALDEQSAQEGRRLVERLNATSPRPQPDTSQTRDAMELTISIDDGGQTMRFSANSTAIDREFGQLLTWIKRQLAHQRGKSGSGP